MHSNYPAIQSWIGLSEGGFVNHPDDPGGATDRGITQATFDAWNRMQGHVCKPAAPTMTLPESPPGLSREQGGCDWNQT